MMRVLVCLCLGAWLLAWNSVQGAEPMGGPPDEVILKDGSRLVGTIKGLGNGVLEIATSGADGGSLKVLFTEVQSIRSAGNHTVVTGDGSQIVGMLRTTPDGRVMLERAEGNVPVSLASMTAINPPPRKDVHQTFTGAINGRVTDGNTRNKNASAMAEYEARTVKNRLNIRGDYNYAEDEAGVTARNARGAVKYDFFVGDRTFVYANTVFEKDKFADLSLRTTLGVGVGYQFLDRTRDERPIDYFQEVGISYFDENYDNAPDDDFIAARVSGKVDWTMRDGLDFFHFHEVYPSLESSDDIYVNTRTGLRITITGNLFANFQVNYRWDNTPAPGNRRGDTEYLFGIGWGYAF